MLASFDIHTVTPAKVSAGFDAAQGDDIGECNVTPAGFAHMTHMLSVLAEGKLVLALEVSIPKGFATERIYHF